MKITRPSPTLMSKLAEGDLNRALHLSKGENVDYSKDLFNWLRTAYKGAGEELSNFSNTIAAWPKDNQLQFLNYGLHFLREYTYLKLTGRDPNLSQTEIEIEGETTKYLKISSDTEELMEDERETIVLFYSITDFKII